MYMIRWFDQKQSVHTIGLRVYLLSALVWESINRNAKERQNLLINTKNWTKTQRKGLQTISIFELQPHKSGALIATGSGLSLFAKSSCYQWRQKWRRSHCQKWSKMCILILTKKYAKTIIAESRYHRWNSRTLQYNYFTENTDFSNIVQSSPKLETY